MTIKLKVHSVGAAVAFILLLAALATCGKVKNNETPDTPADQTCTWDTSSWDQCQLAP